MTDEFQKASETVNLPNNESRPDTTHPRSLFRLSPTNEAAACTTVAEVRDTIEAELALDEPRDWVIALLNERAQELKNNV